MVRLLPAGSCPACGHSQFVVAESEFNLFLTDMDGYVTDSKTMDYKCEGMCCNCKRVFEMIATPERFIPLTPLRKLLYENTHHYELAQREKPADIKNPMGVN